MGDWKKQALGLGIALSGALAFEATGLPLPFLFGALGACLVAALVGLRFRDLGNVSKGARTILGVAAGASITPQVLSALPQMATTILLIPVFIAVIALVGLPFFRALGFDRTTAWYAAMPGGLQDMVIFGEEAGGDPRALSLIHATRVLVIITLTPLVATRLYGVSLEHSIGDAALDTPISELLMMTFAAIGGWKLAERFKLFGAAILGPMIVAACLAQFGLLHARPPREAIMAAQLFIGLGIGAHYVGITVRELGRFVTSGIIFVIILAILSVSFSEAISLLGFAPPLDVFLAFSPGGQAEMALLAMLMGADLGFVVVHHAFRVIIVILGAPLAAHVMRRQQKK
ncbi:AbrB family transcriptional regulator [uncultured Cohaesibacter sp.]|uniref:AbrB family transcriptional regulator n=1 Tax=uncultured Cohaesibacter sp. TaxID=1002546 RepID=UPI00292D240A|nr:AbrB family transcriptional regulator [uncultured Cohaesibacter sp.]